MARGKGKSSVQVFAKGPVLFLPLPTSNPSGSYESRRVFMLEYLPVSVHRNERISLRLHAAMRQDGCLMPTHLSADRRGLTEPDLHELRKLEWYISPQGCQDPRKEPIHQPVGMWLYRNDTLVLSSLMGTQKGSLDHWLARARKEDRDEALFEIATEHRRSKRPLLINHRKKQVVPRAKFVEKPRQTFYLFRGPLAQPDSRKPRPTGVLTSAGRAHAPGRTRYEPVEEPPRKVGELQRNLREQSDLYKLGYRITGTSRRERWRVLTSEAIPNLGLKTVVRTIADNRRRFANQAGGNESTPTRSLSGTTTSRV